ncbi:MAG: nucleotidyl transferase AbiEii/AbiGii toxin family protein [Eubacteriales bacterium]|nr:nucleotidyl transferase AbiEii/AbiGii toxin family protein [Eubacteriales bacterium]
MADIAASVLAKLKNKAKAVGISYQQCLQLFFQEEFLRKLAASRYAENFVLKGGLFIYTLTNFESRATVDVDFLMRGLNNDLARMDEIIAEILAIPTGNDFVSFKASKSEPIAVQRKYHGLSTQIIGYIKNVRVPFNVDIGVGDVIVPHPEHRTIQTQLDGYEKPEILTYSLESTIAEKFDAILQRFELTGRMKDFYDIYYLSRTFDFDGLKLQTAIYETLQNRGTAYEKDSFDRIVALADEEDMQTKWRYFLRTLNKPDVPFQVILDGIQEFLEPVWVSIINEEDFIGWWMNANTKVKAWRKHEGTHENSL